MDQVGIDPVLYRGDFDVMDDLIAIHLVASSVREKSCKGLSNVSNRPQAVIQSRDQRGRELKVAGRGQALSRSSGSPQVHTELAVAPANLSAPLPE